ncbi:hypothetical protein FZW96_07305 [Bacillus sp. BGMRC 2118]|nr:hypothetical protein FZW96_07305 [Bacillus sp. BGMRC 2118]
MVSSINLELVFGSDKQLHFLLFSAISLIAGVFVLLIFPLAQARRNLWTVWFTLIFIGFIEEFRQFRLVDRSTELLDGVANILGASAGIVIPLLIVSFVKQEGKSQTLLLLYVTVIAVLSIGLWNFNERPFIRI